MTQLTKYYIPIVILLLTSDFLFAQKPEEELVYYKELYPDESAIVLKKYQDMYITRTGDSLNISIEHYNETLFLDEVQDFQKKETVYVSSFSKISDLKALTHIPAKRKYKEIQVEDFKETYSKQDFVFYDDDKKIEFTYPQVQPGVKVSYAYKEKLLDPHFTGSHYHSSYIPVVHSRLRVYVPHDVEMDFKEFNIDSTLSFNKKYEADDRMVYEYEAKDVKKITFENQSPSYNFLAPHVGIRINRFKTGNNEWIGVLGSQKDLYNWYWTFIDGLKEDDDPQIKTLVNEIIKNETDELEKVKKIFYWVQRNIKYIAFEQGMRGFIPHKGAYICEKRYGDCKDMASLIVNMLYHAGIKSYFTWVGTRDLPYRYTDYPSPSVDNHMIASYFNGEEVIYLDATAQFISFGYPSSMIQGKEALIAIDKDSFLIKEVPVISYEMSTSIDSSFFELKKGALVGTGKFFFNGYSKFQSKHRLARTNTKSIDDYVKAILMRGNNKFYTKGYDITNLNNYHLPTVITYEFEVPDYYKEVAGNIYFNMNIDKSFYAKQIDDTRKYPYENEFNYLIRHTSILKIPEGYKVKELPEDTSDDVNFFSYKISYRIVDDEIIQDKEYVLNYLLLTSEKFHLWNKIADKLNQDNRQVIIFEHN